ncbi:MAG: hypothetical protein J0G30_04115 [Actinomycetales bacterium]|nr:hypothetical protein [Actinomycetales bacterium]
MPTDFWGNAIYSVIPTIVLGLLFWFVMRAIIRSDRGERAERARIEAEERARRGLPAEPGAAATATESPEGSAVS